MCCRKHNSHYKKRGRRQDRLVYCLKHNSHEKDEEGTDLCIVENKILITKKKKKKKKEDEDGTDLCIV